MIDYLSDIKKINNVILTVIYLFFFNLLVKNNYKSEIDAIFKDRNLKKMKLIFSIILSIYYFFDAIYKEKNKKNIIKNNYYKIIDSLSVSFLFCITLLLKDKPIFYPFIMIFLRTFLIKKDKKFNSRNIFDYIKIFFLLQPFLTLIFNSFKKPKEYINIDKSNIMQHIINFAIGTIIIDKFMNDREYDIITLSFQIMIYTSLYNYTILGFED